MIDRRRRKAVHPTPVARGLQLIAGVTALLGILLVGADPVGAHEIAVAMVIAADEDSGTDPAAVVDGLRLAIDQSPDVGHAAGSDAGDHLGGVDVALTVLDGMETPAEVGDAARRAVADGLLLSLSGAPGWLQDSSPRWCGGSGAGAKAEGSRTG